MTDARRFVDDADLFNVIRLLKDEELAGEDKETYQWAKEIYDEYLLRARGSEECFIGVFVSKDEFTKFTRLISHHAKTRDYIQWAKEVMESAYNE